MHNSTNTAQKKKMAHYEQVTIHYLKWIIFLLTDADKTLILLQN